RLGPLRIGDLERMEKLTDLRQTFTLVGRLRDVTTWEELWIVARKTPERVAPSMESTTPALSRPDFRLPKSQEAFARANRVIPGGVNSPARAFGAVGGEPPFIERAEGAYLHDIDGHTYIDYIGSWGPMILGHAHPRVNAAVAKALGLGTSFGAP